MRFNVHATNFDAALPILNIPESMVERSRNVYESNFVRIKMNDLVGEIDVG